MRRLIMEDFVKTTAILNYSYSYRRRPYYPSASFMQRMLVSSEPVETKDGGGNEEQDLADEEINPRDPMRNHLILMNIFQHIRKINDIKAVRKVCRQWRDLTLQTWRGQMTFKLSLDLSCPSARYMDKVSRSIKAYRDEILLPDYSGLHKYNCFEFDTVPFRHVRIHSITLFPPNFQPNFWTVYGRHITHLDLGYCLFQKYDQLTGLRHLLQLCPNLKELVMLPFVDQNIFPIEYAPGFHYYSPEVMRQEWLRNLQEEVMTEQRKSASAPKGNHNIENGIKSNIRSRGDVTALDLESLSLSWYRKPVQTFVHNPRELFHNVPWLCERFLHMIPNLKSLKLDGFPSHSIFLNALRFVPVRGELIKLESFTFTTRANANHIVLLSDYLADAKPPLKYLNMILGLPDAYYPTVDTTNFRQCLELCYTTVESLYLKFICPNIGILRENSFLDFGHMQFSNLTKVHLWFCYEVETECPMIVFNFRAVFKAMSQLTSFICHFSGYSRGKILKKITCQELEDGPGFWGIANLQQYRQPAANVIAEDAEEKFRDLLRVDKPLFMEHLTNFYFYRSFSSESLKILKEWMPNLTSLSTILDNDTFPLAMKLWPTLEKVELLAGSKVKRTFLKTRKRLLKQERKVNVYLYENWNSFAPPAHVSRPFS